MELFVITSSVESEQAAERFCLRFRALGNLNQTRSVFQITFKVEAERVTVICEGDESVSLSGRALLALKARAADAVGEHVAEHKESMIVQRLLHKYYPEIPQTERPVVEELTRKMLNGEEADLIHGHRAREKHVAEISKGFYEYLQSTSYVDVDGTIAFRMRDYLDTLKETLDYAVDEYLLSKQYEEFIGMLKYFVQFQEPRVPVIHLLHKGGTEFALLDEGLKPVEPLPGQGVSAHMADQELEMEDVVVSTLISLSPKRVVIHTLEPELLIISTIRQIFGERAELGKVLPPQNA
ncbi:putative sporulation protein YtxC [Paenibacillus sp. CAA11]|uniref:putative sporulation protein YtxC n=1 Tax=Paenibacillus sp. CAA11 TaxID=1532905 RepID=UPI00131F06B3|nr:putative sporulation protein YtxC [Paenibacillus sp. CAA11]